MTTSWGQVREAVVRPELWVRLTRVCNERCLFCYDESAMDGTVVPAGAVHRALREGRAKGHTQVNLTGGEPTMHPHFAKLVRLAKLLGYERVHVTTNGRLFKDKSFLDSAVEAGLDTATFSIHGHTEELNDRLTRAAGSFRDSMLGLRNALSAGRPEANVHVVLSRINAPFAGEMLRYFKGLGVRNVNFVQLVPVSAAWDNRRELFPRPEDRWSQLWELFDRSDDPDLRGRAAEFVFRHAEYLASTVRVQGYAGMFQKLLDDGQPQHCRGERCFSCPMDAFCRDLERLRAEGRLEARPPEPLCREKGGRSARPVITLKGATVASFSEFFMTHRLRVRGRECGACLEREGCPGASLPGIMAHGFPAPTGPLLARGPS